jgi:hypothetical protein
MIYEIINPSDKYTMESNDKAAACAACLFLGEGKYALSDMDGNRVLPILAFGNADPNEVMQDTCGITLTETVATKKPAIAAALRSVMIGDPSFRTLWKDASEETKAKYLDENRSSMNNIAKRAQQLADHFTDVANKQGGERENP